MRPRKALVGAFVWCAVSAPGVARAETVTFQHTGAEQTFTVPAGVTTVNVLAVGGRGGKGGFGGANGGFGAVALADVPVSDGQVLYVQVGGNGAPGEYPGNGVGGFNGGGTSGTTFNYQGAGGGGASDVRTAPRAATNSLSSRLVTAAGGGGGGAYSSTAVGGGAGAAGAGGTGGGGGGQPGTDSAGGAGGTSSPSCVGGSGAFGLGGAGGQGICASGSSASGGGGGGGLFGGGGGGGNNSTGGSGGGGGGSSGFAPSAANTFVGVDSTGTPLVRITYTPPPSTGGSGGGGGGSAQPTSTPPPADAVAPVGSALRFSSTAFRALRRGGPVARSSGRRPPPRGTRVSYRLSETASVRFTVARAVVGRRVGSRCVRRTRANAGRPRCTRFVTRRGSFLRSNRAAGTDSFRFSGRWRGRALAPGRYRLTGVPTDAAGNRGRSFSGRFRILP